MRKTIFLITACLMITVLFSACSVLQKLGLQKNDDELRPVSSIVLGEEEAKKLSDKVPVHLYFANEDNTKLVKEIRYIPMSEAKKSTSSLASAIVKELINGPAEGSPLKPTIPAGTQLRSPVTVSAGIATVDLTGDFIEKHPGGKAAEQMTIFSIVNSLTELKEIQKVKFLIDGKARKEFKGNFQFDAPFARSHSLISKEPVISEPLRKDDSTDKSQKDGKENSGNQQGTTGTQGSSGEESTETSEDLSDPSEETYLELEDLEEYEILE